MTTARAQMDAASSVVSAKTLRQRAATVRENAYDMLATANRMNDDAERISGYSVRTQAEQERLAWLLESLPKIEADVDAAMALAKSLRQEAARVETRATRARHATRLTQAMKREQVRLQAERDRKVQEAWLEQQVRENCAECARKVKKLRK